MKILFGFHPREVVVSAPPKDSLYFVESRGTTFAVMERNSDDAMAMVVEP